MMQLQPQPLPPQQVQEEEEGLDPVSYYNKPVIDDSLGSLQYQLDSTDIIEDIKHILKNEQQYVLNGRPVWRTPKGMQPLINDVGLGNIISVLKSRLTKIMILSDLEQSTIERFVHDIHEDLTDDFYYNWDKYEVKDLATASLVISLVTDTVYATLRKGYTGNYMKLLRSMHSIAEIQQVRQNGAVNSGGGISDRISSLLFKKKR